MLDYKKIKTKQKISNLLKIFYLNRNLFMDNKSGRVTPQSGARFDSSSSLEINRSNTPDLEAQRKEQLDYVLARKAARIEHSLQPISSTIDRGREKTVRYASSHDREEAVTKQP